MKVRQISLKDFQAIKSLWLQAFGDEEENFCHNFLLNYKQKQGFCIEEQGEICAMAFVLYQKQSFWSYIFACATSPKHRNKGFMRALLDKICDDNKKQNRASILVPSNANLFSFYEKLGFETVSYLDFFELSNNFEPHSLKQINITFSQAKKLRDKCFNNSEFASWNASHLKFAPQMVGFSSGESIGVAFVEKNEQTAFVKEIFFTQKINLQQFANFICQTFNVSSVQLRVKTGIFSGGEKKPFSMARNFHSQSLPFYFNLPLD